MRNLTCVMSVGAVLAAAAGAMGQLSYTTPGSVYGNTFDTLASATSGLTNPWTNDSTMPGWFLYGAQNTAITTYAAGDGSNATGGFWSYGSLVAGGPPSTERALGGLGSGSTYFSNPTPASGAVAGWIAFGVTNNTGSTLTDFSVSFRGEQWRANNASAQTMVLEYGFGATFATVGTWIAPGGSFDFTSPVPLTAGAIDGNAAGLVTGLGGNISSLAWLNGDTLWIRWTERNDAGNDHGLAIDDFSFSARVPAPSALAVLGLGGIIAGRRRRN